MVSKRLPGIPGMWKNRFASSTVMEMWCAEGKFKTQWRKLGGEENFSGIRSCFGCFGLD